MNHSIHSADRSTHLKIVVVALVAGIAVAAFGISARTVGLHPDRPGREGRQASGCHQFGPLDDPLNDVICIGIKTAALGRPFCLRRVLRSLLSH